QKKVQKIGKVSTSLRVTWEDLESFGLCTTTSCANGLTINVPAAIINWFLSEQKSDDSETQRLWKQLNELLRFMTTVSNWKDWEGICAKYEILRALLFYLDNEGKVSRTVSLLDFFPTS